MRYPDTISERNIIFEFDEELWYLSASPRARVLNIEMSGITHPDPSYHIYRDNTWNLYVLEYVLSGSGFIDSGGHRYTVRGETPICCAASPGTATDPIRATRLRRSGSI